MFDKMVTLAESLSEYSSSRGNTRGFPLSKWYGKDDGDDDDYVVDYDSLGDAQRVQKVGTTKMWTVTK